MLEVEPKSQEVPSYSSIVAGNTAARPNVIAKEIAPKPQVLMTTLRRGKKVDNSIRKLDLIPITISNNSGLQLEVDALPDTGANINVMPIAMARRFGIEAPKIDNPKCANGSALEIAGPKKARTGCSETDQGGFTDNTTKSGVNTFDSGNIAYKRFRFRYKFEHAEA